MPGKKYAKRLFDYDACTLVISINNLKIYNEYFMGYSCCQSLIIPGYV